MKTPVGQLNPAIRDVHIWGGGVSGLLMAHHLSKEGYKIHLYERAERLGGKIHSHQLASGVIEEGPNAIFATPEIESWLKSLGLVVIAATPKLKRRIWNQKPYAPLSLSRVIKLVTRLWMKTPAFTDETTVADFFRPLLDKDVEELLSPALQGIYGSGAHELTVTSLWPHLPKGVSYFEAFKSIKGPRARSVSFTGGMQEFINALAQSFQGEIHLNYQDTFVLRPNTIICTDAHTAGELLQTSWPSGARLLSEVQYLPLQSVAVLNTPPTETYRTFGYLFPRTSGIHSLGVLFNQEIFAGRTGMTFIVPGLESADSRVSTDLQRLGWSSGEMKIHSWKKALPRYNHARTQTIKKLHSDKTRPDGLVLFGNYVAGISLRDMIQVSASFASLKRLH
jgi:oxygen-dependent protoporphyrinogen oxidase